ncbi:MAG: hypothetical protein NT031_16520, partial [Planctomycetota bacterium]|nr:hypothetical protein [Planctomycetota bacterium]
MRTGGGMAVWAILATAAWAGPASQPATRDAQGVIEIRVVDESGGASLGGAKVLVSASKTIEAFTDEKGIARFALPAGKYAVGAPVKNVRVQLLPGDPDGGAVTDDQGRFEITVERPHGWGDSMPMLLLFRHEGRGLAGAVGVAEDSRDLQVALGPGATLAGRVTDEQGKPVPD